MGPTQTSKFLHSKRNPKQHKKTTHRIRIPANTSRIIKIHSFTVTEKGEGGGFYMLKIDTRF